MLSRSASTATRSPTKLSYREQRELENLPKQIEDLESELAALEETVATPDFYSRHNEVVQDTLRLLSEKRSLIDAAIQRWSELEDRQQQLRKR